MPSTARPLSERGVDTAGELDAFGSKLYTALASGSIAPVMLDDAALRALLLPDAASRLVAQRRATPTLALPAEAGSLLRSARYAGLCVQQGRVEPRAGTLGLRASGFVFDRALLIGREAGGGAVASWVEGHFLHTDVGFGALSVERVESPRRDHADLELAECELRVEARVHKD